MKPWQFWLLLAVVSVTLAIVVKMALGLLDAQQRVGKITTPIENLISKLGL